MIVLWLAFVCLSNLWGEYDQSPKHQVILSDIFDSHNRSNFEQPSSSDSGLSLSSLSSLKISLKVDVIEAEQVVTRSLVRPQGLSFSPSSTYLRKRLIGALNYPRSWCTNDARPWIYGYGQDQTPLRMSRDQRPYLNVIRWPLSSTEVRVRTLFSEGPLGDLAPQLDGCHWVDAYINIRHRGLVWARRWRACWEWCLISMRCNKILLI